MIHPPFFWMEWSADLYGSGLEEDPDLHLLLGVGRPFYELQTELRPHDLESFDLQVVRKGENSCERPAIERAEHSLSRSGLRLSNQDADPSELPDIDVPLIPRQIHHCFTVLIVVELRWRVDKTDEAYVGHVFHEVPSFVSSP